MATKHTPQGIETIDATVCDGGDNVAPNVENPAPNVAKQDCNVAIPPLPCSRRAAAKALMITDVTVGRWVKGLESKGQTITDQGKITATGFNALIALKTATDGGQSLGDYLATLTPAPAPTATETTALVVSHRDNVALATNQALSREANLKAEFFALLSEEQEDRDFEADIEEMRLAKIRERAYREFLQEERESQRIKRELKAAKLALELGGDHNA